jgi:hypothetical protein
VQLNRRAFALAREFRWPQEYLQATARLPKLEERGLERPPLESQIELWRSPPKATAESVGSPSSFLSPKFPCDSTLYPSARRNPQP